MKWTQRKRRIYTKEGRCIAKCATASQAAYLVREYNDAMDALIQEYGIITYEDLAEEAAKLPTMETPMGTMRFIEEPDEVKQRLEHLRNQEPPDWAEKGLECMQNVMRQAEMKKRDEWREVDKMMEGFMPESHPWWRRLWWKLTGKGPISFVVKGVKVPDTSKVPQSIKDWVAYGCPHTETYFDRTIDVLWDGTEYGPHIRCVKCGQILK